MWPKKSTKYNQGLDPDLITFGGDNVDYVYLRMLQEITACLEKWTGMSLDYSGYFIPAALIFDPSRDPLFSEMGQSHGVGETRKVLKRLKATRRLQKGAARLPKKRAADKAAIHQTVVSYISDLPRPASMFIEKALRTGGAAKLAEVVDALCDLYEAYEAEQRSETGNIRAYRTALVLRAVFEVHTDLEVKAKNVDNVPDNTFTECLKELFLVAGLDSKFYHFARRACKCPSTDAEFLEIKALIENKPTEFQKIAKFY